MGELCFAGVRPTGAPLLSQLVVSRTLPAPCPSQLVPCPGKLRAEQHPLGFPEAASRWSSQREGRGGVPSRPTPIPAHSSLWAQNPHLPPYSRPLALAHPCPAPAQWGRPLWTTRPRRVLFPGRSLTVSFQWCLKSVHSPFKPMLLLPVHQTLTGIT